MQWPEPRLGPVRPRLDWQIEERPVNQPGKQWIKHLLGELPLTAELYWQLRQNGKPLSQQLLPAPRSQMAAGMARTVNLAWHAGHLRNWRIAPKKVLIFATLRYWIEHAVLTGHGAGRAGTRGDPGILALRQLAQAAEPLRPAPPERLQPERAYPGCSRTW